MSSWSAKVNPRQQSTGYSRTDKQGNRTAHRLDHLARLGDSFVAVELYPLMRRVVNVETGNGHALTIAPIAD